MYRIFIKFVVIKKVVFDLVVKSISFSFMEVLYIMLKFINFLFLDDRMEIFNCMEVCF